MTTWYTRKPLACRHGHSFPSRPWGLCPVSAAPPSERLRALPQPCCCLFLCRLLRCRSRSLLFLYLLDSLCGCGGGGCCCCCCLLLCFLYSRLFCSPLYLLPLPLPPAVQWRQQPQPQPPPVLSLQPPLLQPSWLLCLFLCRLLHCRSRSLLFLHLLDSVCGCGSLSLSLLALSQQRDGAALALGHINRNIAARVAPCPAVRSCALRWP